VTAPDKAPDPAGQNVLPLPDKPAAKKTPAEKPPRPAKRTHSKKKLDGTIEKLIIEGSGWVILAAAAAGNDRILWDAKVVVYQAAPLSREIAKMLDKNPRMKGAVEAALNRTGAMSTVAVLAGTVVPILAGHGVISADAAALAAPAAMEALGPPPARKAHSVSTPSPAAGPSVVSSETVAAGTAAGVEPSPQAAEVAARLARSGVLDHDD